MVAHLARRKSARTHGSFDGGDGRSRHSRLSIGSGSISTQSPLEGYGQVQVGPYHQTRQHALGHPDPQSDSIQDQEVTNEAAAALFQSPINTPGDALHLLLKASGESEDVQNHGTTGKSKLQDQRVYGRQPAGKSPLYNGSYGILQQPRQPTNVVNIDPAIADPGNGTPSPSRGALTIWARLRFVRAGWFTAKEAVAYID